MKIFKKLCKTIFIVILLAIVVILFAESLIYASKTFPMWVNCCIPFIPFFIIEGICIWNLLSIGEEKKLEVKK